MYMKNKMSTTKNKKPQNPWGRKLGLKILCDRIAKHTTRLSKWGVNSVTQKK